MRTKKIFNCCHNQIKSNPDVRLSGRNRKRKWVSEEFHQYEIRTRNAIRSQKSDDTVQKRRKSIGVVTEYDIQTRSSLRNKKINEITPEDFDLKRRKSSDDSVGHEMRTRSSLRGSKIDISLDFSGRKQRAKNFKVETLLGRRSSIESSRCKFCHVTNDRVVKYGGPPTGARKERQVLKIEELCLEDDVIDEKPQTKLTEYSVYDKLNHLCSFDGNLIEQNVALYFSGYVKPITDENPSTAGGYPCKDMGPVTEWWVAGYDGGEKAIIGISSEFGDYYLMEPRKEYAPFMASVNEKIFITKSVIDLLQEGDYEDALTYEDLLDKLEEINLPSGSGAITEDILLKHADFIYDQILSYDNSADPDDKLLIDSCCIKRLARMTGINVSNRQKKNSRRRCAWRKKEIKFSKAATTRLVENVFEKFFQAQMDKSLNDNSMFQRCVVRLISLENLGWKLEDNVVVTVADIENRLIVPKIEPDKENIELKSFSIKLTRLDEKTLDKYLNKKPKRGRCKKITKDSSYVYSEDEDYVPDFGELFYDDDSDTSISDSGDSGVESFTTRTNRRVERKDTVWLDEAMEINDKYYFMSARVDDIDVKVNDFVTTRYSNSVAHIKYMYESEAGEKLFHGHWFIASRETMLQEIGNPQELFLSEECEDISLYDIIAVVDVTMLPILSNWNVIGNMMLSEFTSESKRNSKKFFYQKRYNAKNARFEDLQEEEKNTDIIHCSNCERKKKEKRKEIPYTDEAVSFDNNEKLYSINVIHWREDEFRIGSCVFLTPGTIMKFPVREKEIPNDDEDYDEDIYPEKYRKSVKTKRDDEQAPEPFDVGYITGIFSKTEKIKKISDVRLKVKKFYRPQNTHQDQKAVYQSNLNLLYWSEEECFISFEHVQGKCYVSYKKNLFEPIQTWSQKGPYRFYFSYTFNSKTKSFSEPSPFAARIGKIDKCDKTKKEKPISYPSISRPLRSLDVFAGCGGLSEGLHQANVAECRWAIEKDPAAAHAFRRNYPNATVFTEDCNKLLNCILNNDEKRNGQRLPRKGEVELLCGGPPCQGYSGMNRFNNGQCSKFNNSLIVSYLSYCDYYRPRFFIMENVRNFVSHQNGTVLKLTLDCLIKMGYQVTFGVLQSGHFGIPQSRRRVIILAAAPGEILPWFPEPTHTFKQTTFLQTTFNAKKIVTNAKWSSAPYRMITVYDAISDLPPISNGDHKEERPYGKEPLTNFQLLVRKVFGQESNILRDHITKDMNALVEKRMSYIPKDGDWRDLPNIVVPLDDGTYTRKLKYTHHDVKYGKSSTGALRGVCCCASKQKCKPEEYKQSDTIIPWCLPHTGSRHNHWQGLYGRLQWDNYFRTVVTNPEPMGKQGRVLHPEQNRVVSVRECARSQGFADSFQFYGSILDKYRQIGNAVAPPLAKAIALEIKKSIQAIESKID